MTAIFTVQLACDWPQCDSYADVSWSSAKRLSAKARRWAADAGWSWSHRGVRCPDHRGKRAS